MPGPFGSFFRGGEGVVFLPPPQALTGSARRATNSTHTTRMSHRRRFVMAFEKKRKEKKWGKKE